MTFYFGYFGAMLTLTPFLLVGYGIYRLFKGLVGLIPDPPHQFEEWKSGPFGLPEFVRHHKTLDSGWPKSLAEWEALRGVSHQRS